jgi:flagellar biosynthesis protein FliQ
MFLKMLIVTVIVGILLVLLSALTSSKQVTKDFLKKGLWIILGTFVALFLFALLLKSMS